MQLWVLLILNPNVHLQSWLTLYLSTRSRLQEKTAKLQERLGLDRALDTNQGSVKKEADSAKEKIQSV